MLAPAKNCRNASDSCALAAARLQSRSRPRAAIGQFDLPAQEVVDPLALRRPLAGSVEQMGQRQLDGFGAQADELTLDVRASVRFGRAQGVFMLIVVAMPPWRSARAFWMACRL